MRLIRRLSKLIDGVDLSMHAVGDVFDVSEHDAALLIAEGWAQFCRDPELERRAHTSRGRRADASQRPNRRAEDRFREALHDARAITVRARRRRR